MKQVRVSIMENCHGYKSLCIERPGGESGTRVAGPKIYYDSSEICHFIVDADTLKKDIDVNSEEVEL